MLGASLTSVGGVSAPESADRGHFYPVSPLVPGPGEKEGSACLGTGTTGTYLNVHDHQYPSFPQGEVEGAVGLVHSMAVPWRSQTTMESQAKRADIFSSF